MEMTNEMEGITLKEVRLLLLGVVSPRLEEDGIGQVWSQALASARAEGFAQGRGQFQRARQTALGYPR